MFERPLIYKLSLIFLLFLGMLFHASTLFENKEQIVSHYPLFSVVLASAALGIIFSTSIYNLALFLYNRDRRYLYYTLAQWSILLFLITLDSLYIAPFNTLFALQSFFLHDLSQILIVLFSSLFIKHFLSYDPNSPKLSPLIQTILILMTLDLLFLLLFQKAIIIRLIPAFLFIWLIISESKRHLSAKNRAYWFFYYGWHLVIVMAILVYTNTVSLLSENFPFLHLTLAFEAILMSFAISYQIALLEEEKKAQESLLLQQSRLASMGEMIASIAHQWRQPLTHLGYLLMNTKKSLSNKEKARQKIQEAQQQIQYMSQTINDFRTFYNPSKNKELFSIYDALTSTLTIISPILTQEGIALTIDTKEDFKLFGNKNELQQALLNLITNAKEALLKTKIQAPHIRITIQVQSITIQDNAQGIPKQLQKQIFEPYFSTKKEGDGIGLYIVKRVIERGFRGRVKIKSDKEGSCFILEF